MPIYITRSMLCITICTGVILATPYKRSSADSKNTPTTLERRYTDKQKYIIPKPHQRRSYAQSLHEKSLQYTDKETINEVAKTISGIIRKLTLMQQVCEAPWKNAYNYNQYYLSSDEILTHSGQINGRNKAPHRPSDIVYREPLTTSEHVFPSARELIYKTTGDASSNMKIIQAIPSILLERSEILLPHLSNLDLHFYSELVRINTQTKSHMEIHR